VNEPKASPEPEQLSRDDMMSALFANMVVQQTNMALMFLGQVPHPHSGEKVRDLDAARMFIDQLEMLETKTKGNLNKHEEALLKRNLTALRMAFVEAINQKAPATPSPEPSKTAPASGAASAAASATEQPASGEAAATTAPDADSRKKFSKKY
jgi:hypothetical protein